MQTAAAVTAAFIDTPIGPAFSTTGKAYETTTPGGSPLKPIDLYPKDTAALLRRVLKAAFPGTKFSVTTGRGSMVSSVDVRWTDGPTVSEVSSLVWRFKAGSFNGMTDSYEYDRDRKVVVDGVLYRPCCQYVDTGRTLSVELVRRCVARLVAFWGGIDAANVPTVEADRWGGYALKPEGISNAKVRPDLGGEAWSYYHTWHNQIGQCAGDPGKFVHGPEMCLAEYATDAAVDAANARLAEVCLAASDAATVPTL